jgi:hypothetical protein
LVLGRVVAKFAIFWDICILWPGLFSFGIRPSSLKQTVFDLLNRVLVSVREDDFLKREWLAVNAVSE